MPFGYRAAGDSSLHVDDDQADTVRRIFLLRSRGSSLRQMTADLNALFRSTAQGRKATPTTVSNILENPRYRGSVEYGFTFGRTEQVLERPTFPQHCGVMAINRCRSSGLSRICP
ncbi:MAG: recombinase family protein [Limnobacter sp.]|uniref:recombinase family protein n=1 Tax=Limnobacter sp. TaxID=2003368 RepID=UPI00391919DB